MSESTRDVTAELDLVSFVWSVYDDLTVITRMGYPLFVLSDQTEDGASDLSEFVAWLSDAWPSVLGTRQEVIGRIRDTPQEVLAAYGLDGLELRVKLILWRRARNHLIRVMVDEGEELSYEGGVGAAPPNLQPALPQAGRFRRTKKVLKWVSRTLGHADTVLGSLAAVVNQAERLKEIKETVEKVSGEASEDIDE